VRSLDSGVGSKGSHPVPGNHTSTQACASSVVINLESPITVPGVKPTATRAGTCWDRSMIAIAEANCSQ
jgi:hypothetical protein